MARQRQAEERRAEVGFLRVARALAARGYDLPTDAWLSGIVGWLASQKRDLVVRKGRGARGSSTLCMWALAHALHSPWIRRPGTTTVGVVMSNTLANGKDVIAKLADMAERLKVPHESTTDRVRLLEHPWEFRLYAANPSSFLGIEPGLVIIDEADAENEQGSANSLRLIVERLTPRMRDPEARLALLSAPYSFDGFFAERCELGETSSQTFLQVPTWEGNPEESEASCRAAAIDEVHFLQAFAAIPQERVSRRPFRRDDIDAAFTCDHGSPVGRRLVACDPSSGAGDGFVWLVAGANRRSDGTILIAVDVADGQFGKWADRVGGGEVIARMAGDAKACGAVEVHSDAREVLLLRTELPRHGLHVVIHQHSTDSKSSAVDRLKLWLESGLLALPARNGERIKRALLDYREGTTRTGQVRFGGKGRRPDDFVAALVTLALAEQSGALEGSRNARTRDDPPPRAGGPRAFANHTAAHAQPIDRLTIGADGRAYLRRPTGGPGRGGF